MGGNGRFRTFRRRGRRRRKNNFRSATMAGSPFNEPGSPRLSRCDAAGSRVRAGRRLRGLRWGIAPQEGLHALKHPRPTRKASASQKSLLVSSFRLNQRVAGAVGRIV